MMYRKMRWLLFTLLIASLVLTACGGGAATPTTAEDSSGKLPGAEDDTVTGPSAAGLVTSLEGVQSATIQIEAQGSFEDPQFGLLMNVAGYGSGFIIDPSGIAITNNHVVTGAAFLQVYIGGDPEPYNARVLGVSECSDLAVIDIDGDGFNYLGWYEGEITPGLDVYAAGFPLGDPEFTLTRGIVSKARADGETEWASVDAVVEHDATINPGNSGGPLVTTEGEVVGVNYAGASGTNQYFAIAREEAMSIIDQLREGNDVDSIGVNGVAVVSSDGTISGIWVSSVASGSPADVAGIEPADVILTLENFVLATDGTMSDYCDVLRTHSPGDTLAVEVLRFDSGEFLEGQINGRALDVAGTFGTTTGGTTTGGTTTGGTTSGSYTTITDDTGALIVDVPSSWSDVNGQPFEMDGVYIASVWAAPSIQDFLDYWSAPGMEYNVISDASYMGGHLGFLADREAVFSGACSNAGRTPYQDAVFTGQYTTLTNCGGGGTTYIIFTGYPTSSPSEFIVWIEVQLPNGNMSTFQQIMNSFNVVGSIQGSGSSSGGSTGGSTSGYVWVTDDYESIALEVPSSWSQVDGGAWVVDGNTWGASITASPNISNFINTWSTPGVSFYASDYLATQIGYLQLLDARFSMFNQVCDYDDRYDYQDALYRGRIDVFTQCGGSGGPDYLVLSAVDRTDATAFLILVEAQLTSSDQYDAFQHILDSFQVIGRIP